MSQINWGLAVPPNIGETFLRSFERGQAMGQQRRTHNALAAYAQNPDDPKAFTALAQNAPQFAIKIGQDRQAAARQAQEQRRADLPLLTRLVETATDEASYQRNRAIAQEYGIDTSTLPPSFDPAWQQQQLATLKALQDPAKMEALSTAGKVAADMGLRPGSPEFHAKVVEIYQAEAMKFVPLHPGGGLAQVNPLTNQTQMAITPNPGSAPVGSPVGGGNPVRITSPAEYEGLPPGTRYIDPNGKLRVKGGGGGNVTGNFLDGLQP
jgi:hypothetical protein